MVLAASTAACVAVAAAVDKPLWAAAVGGGLVLAYWAIEALTWRRARDRSGLALGLAVGGMFLRLGVALAVLVCVGVLARPAFATAALSFLVGFTLYLGLRPFTYAPPARPSHGVGTR